MYRTELMEDILKSPAAWDIINELSPIYGEARVALWLFQVIGAELDETRKWTQEVEAQTVPQTATWSIGMWEDSRGLARDPTLSLQQRRDRVLTNMSKRAPMNPWKLEQIASVAAGANCRIIERTGAGSVFTLVVTDFYPSKTGEKKIRAAVDRAKQARLSYLIRYEQIAPKSVCAYAATAITGAVGRLTVVIPTRIMPHPSTVKGYAAGTASSGAIRASVTVRGKVRPQTTTVRSYAAACQQSSAGSVVVSIRERIEQQKMIPVRGYANVQATQSAQRMEVTVEGRK